MLEQIQENMSDHEIQSILFGLSDDYFKSLEREASKRLEEKENDRTQ